MNPTIKYTLTAQHLTITSEIEMQIKKVVLALQKYVEHGDESASAHFVLRFEKRHTSTGMYTTEIDFHARHMDISAKGEKESLVSALDEARDEIVGALSTRKEKKIHFIRKSARRLKTLFKGFSREK